MNACNTYSAAWANAFGFDFYPDGTQDILSDYIDQGRQPQVFVGWREEIDVPSASASALEHLQYTEALAGLFSRWMANYSIVDCLARYSAIMNSYGFDGHSSWALSGCLHFNRSAP